MSHAHRLRKTSRWAFLFPVLLSAQAPKFRPAPALDFILDNGATPEKIVTETMVGGVAAFDFDGDGLVDLFFTNGAGPNRLYRNLGNFRFEDATKGSGLEGTTWTNGAAAADYDNDGRVDLFVSGVRENHLYRNLGKGKFAEVTAKAGIKSGVWAITGGWLDYDNDGRPDLFVANYLDLAAQPPPDCTDPVKKVRSYCHPRNYKGLRNALYRNRGDGTFEDVSEPSGIWAHIGKAMSASFADYDGDGFTDIFVTNDKMPNFLFHNLGNGKFEEAALQLGAALPDSGREISGMGSDFRDYDNDGRPDIVYAALANETFPLFRNAPVGGFRAYGRRSGLDTLTLRRSGWSPVLADLNNDGYKDLFVSGAHVSDNIELFEATTYKLPNSIFSGGPNGTFNEAALPPELQTPRAHRGAVVADLNNDGRLDIVTTAIGEHPVIWENITEAENSWVVVKVSLGAKVRVGGQWNHMTTAVGYSSSTAQGVHFGLGKAKSIETVEITWPGGKKRVLRDVEPNRVVDVAEQ